MSRNCIFDIAKGIGIMTVVFGHAVCPLTKFFYLFHMPLFFILSGYFFKAKYYSNISELKQFFIKKLKSLYLIIVITNIVYVSYDIADNLKPYKSKDGNDLKYYSGVIVLGIVAFIYMIISKDLFNTCTLTLGLNLLVPAYVWIIKIITTKISGA